MLLCLGKKSFLDLLNIHVNDFENGVSLLGKRPVIKVKLQDHMEQNALHQRIECKAFLIAEII